MQDARARRRRESERERIAKRFGHALDSIGKIARQVEIAPYYAVHLAFERRDHLPPGALGVAEKLLNAFGSDQLVCQFGCHIINRVGALVPCFGRSLRLPSQFCAFRILQD
jgi:hypothetical protein